MPIGVCLGYLLKDYGAIGYAAFATVLNCGTPGLGLDDDLIAYF